MAKVQLRSKFILSEVNDYSAINVPLKTTGRIKYTCFDVSQTFLVFGATSGGLYVFKREPCTFIQLLPNKEGPVILVSISPDEKLFAFATQRGNVCILERSDGTSTRLLNRSVEHAGSCITALQWANTSDQIFIGDIIGRLSVINVSLFMSKNIFQIPAFVFMQLDSGVVQISCREDRLLISTLSHSYVCDTAKEQYRQIGTKSRDGEYGACYSNDKIYCARPGSRLWEVDLEGNVQSTHQFKQLLAIKPSLIVTDDGLIDCSVNDKVSLKSNDETVSFSGRNSYWPEQSFNFVKLSPILKFIFTFKPDGIYIFDPDGVNVVLWSNNYDNIIDAKCLNDYIYIWNNHKRLIALNLLTLDKCLLKLLFCDTYRICAELLLYFINNDNDYLFLNSDEFLIKLFPLIKVKEYILNNHDNVEIIEKSKGLLLKFIEKLESVSINKSKIKRLDCGIFMLENQHVCQKMLYENADENNELDDVKRNDNEVNFEATSSLSSSSSSSSSENTRNLLINNTSSSSLMSLPELIRSSGKSNLIDEQQTLNYDNVKTITYNIPQFPFLPLTSPDIIHDTLLELSCNVTDKVKTGTKTFIDKWQIFEGKFKLNKISNTYDPLDFRSNNSSNLDEINSSNNRNNESNLLNGHRKCDNESDINLTENGFIYKSDVCLEDDDDDEDVVTKKSSNVTKSKTNVMLKKQKFQAIELINVCNKIVKLVDKNKNFDFKVVLNEILFATVNSYKQYCDFILELNSNNDGTKTNLLLNNDESNYFHFNEFLPENFIIMIKNMFHDSLKNSELLKWLINNFLNNNSGDEKSKVIDKNEIIFINYNKFNVNLFYPEVLYKVYPKDVLYLDYLLSKMIVIFSELLDPYIILYNLEKTELDCYYLSWLAVMNRFQDGALRYFSTPSATSSDDVNNQNDEDNDDDGKDLNDTVKCKDWPMPLLLNAIYLLLQLDQVDAAVKIYIDSSNVKLIVISYVILQLTDFLNGANYNSQQYLNKSTLLVDNNGGNYNKKCSHLFLLFINRILNYNCLNLIDYQNKGLLMHIEQSFILVNKELNYAICQCGFPKVNTNVNCSNKSNTKNSNTDDNKITNIVIIKKSDQKSNSAIKFSNIAELLLNHYWDSRSVKPDILSSSHVTSSNLLNSNNVLSQGSNNNNISNCNIGQNDENFWSLLCNIDETHITINSSELLEHIKNICSVAPTLIMWLLKNKISNDHDYLFNVKIVLILQLCYLNELDNYVNYNYKIGDSDCNENTSNSGECNNIYSVDEGIVLNRWEQIINLNIRIEKGECCVCNRKYEPIPGINWSKLAPLMLKNIGPTNTLNIFKKYIQDMPHGALFKRFYQACVLSKFIESRVNVTVATNSSNCYNNNNNSSSNCSNVVSNKDLIVNTVDRVVNNYCDNHKGNNSFPSSIAVISSTSQAGVDLAHALSLDLVTESDIVQKTTKLINNDKSNGQSYRHHHWGTTVDLELGCCNLCSLSLGTPCLLMDTGLRVFKCGHGFHYVCLNVKKTLENCPICCK